MRERLRRQTAEQTVLLFALIFPLQIHSPLQISPQISNSVHCVVVPDKQNLLDQADFTAVPAHMAASVAHFLSSHIFSPSSLFFYVAILLSLHSLCCTFVMHFNFLLPLARFLQRTDAAAGRPGPAFRFGVG